MKRANQRGRTTKQKILEIGAVILLIASIPMIFYLLYLLISLVFPQIQSFFGSLLVKMNMWRVTNRSLYRIYTNIRFFFEHYYLILWGIMITPAVIAAWIEEKKKGGASSSFSHSRDSEEFDAKENEREFNYLMHGVYGNDTGRAKYINGEPYYEVKDPLGKKYWVSPKGDTIYEED